MTTVDQLLSWDPAAIGASAEGLNADRKALVDLQDEMDAGSPPATWQGEAATAAGSSHHRIYLRLADLVAAVSPVVEALDVAQVSIKSAQESVRSAQSTIAAEGWRLDESGGSVRVSAPAPASSGGDEGFGEVVAEQLDEARMTMLAQQIADALQAATEADAELASVLNGARVGSYDGGDGTLADAALPPAMRGLSDDELVDYMFKHPEETAPYLDALTERQRQAVGSALSTRWDDLAVPVVPLGDEDAYPTQDELDSLNELTAAFGEDPVVATTLLQQLGPHGVLEIQSTLLANPPGGADGVSWESVGQSQQIWGHTLAAGTSGSDSGPGGADHVSAQWIDQLEQAGEAHFDLSPGVGGGALGYQLLSPLLATEGQGSYLLNQVGTSMETFEHDFTEENGASPWDFYTHPADFDLTHLEDGMPDRDYPNGHDPFGGLMEGLSHNPDAARDFFNDPNGDSMYDDRVDHYLNDRDWSNLEAYSDRPSEIGTLGDALQTATLVDPNADSASIMNDVVDAAGDPDHELHPELRSDVGTMVSHYMPSVFDTMNGDHPLTTGDPVPWLPGEQRADLMVDFDPDSLKYTLDQVGRSEDAGQIVQDAASTYANLGYDTVFSGGADDQIGGGPQDTDSVWDRRLDLADRRVSDPYAHVSGYLGGGYVDQLRADGLAADAANSASGDSAWKVGGFIAEQAVGHVPVVGGFGDFLVGQGVDAITGANDVNTTEHVEQQMGHHLSDVSGSAQAMAQNAVYRNLPDDVLQHIGDNGHGGSVFEQPDGTRLPMSEWGDEQSDAWRRAQDLTGVSSTGGGLQDAMEQRIISALTDRDQFMGNYGEQTGDGDG